MSKSYHTLTTGGNTIPLEQHEVLGPILPGATNGGNIPVGTADFGGLYKSATYKVGNAVYAWQFVPVRGELFDEEDNYLEIECLVGNSRLNKLWALQYGALLARSEGVNAFVLNGKVEYVTDRGTTSYPDLFSLLFDDTEEERAALLANEAAAVPAANEDDDKTLVDSQSQEDPKDSAQAEKPF